MISPGMSSVVHADSSQTVPHYILDRVAAEEGNRPFLAFGDRSLSFVEVNRQSRRVANGLKALGIGRGDTVLKMLPNNPECIYAWFGTNMLGAIEVPLNTANRGAILLHQVNNSLARTMIIHVRYLERLLQVSGDLKHLERLIVQGTVPAALADAAPYEIVPFERLLHSVDEPLPRVVESRDIMQILYTSGTTGPSKGVMLTYAQMRATSDPVIAMLRRDDVNYCPFPMFHISGTFAVYSSLVTRGQTVIREVFSATDFWPDVRRYGVTFTNLLGAIANFVSQWPPTPEDRNHTLKKALMIPLTKHLDAFKQRFGVQVFTFFNMTEISSPIASDGFNLVDNQSCGRLRPGYYARIVDEHDYEVPAGTVGELVLRADEPWVLNAGYWQMPEKTAEAWRNQWLHTGDAFKRDENGNFYFVDRMKDMIRRRGENISSWEVEAEINAHPAVLESAAVAVPSEFAEDEIKAWIILKPGARMDPAKLVRFLEPRLPYFMIPRYFEFTDDFPRTPNLKVQRIKLRERGIGEAWDREKSGIRLAK